MVPWKGLVLVPSPFLVPCLIPWLVLCLFTCLVAYPEFISSHVCHFLGLTLCLVLCLVLLLPILMTWMVMYLVFCLVNTFCFAWFSALFCALGSKDGSLPCFITKSMAGFQVQLFRLDFFYCIPWFQTYYLFSRFNSLLLLLSFPLKSFSHSLTNIFDKWKLRYIYV